MARTRDRYDAEDLAQDIIAELVKSACNIRDDKAFYGFMWAVAGNVYAMWCRKRAKNNICELSDDMADNTDYYDVGANDDIYLLRRELALLSEKYRKAAILYYVESKSCAEISAILGISESMVKYLLFKARKILKEGMDMERNYGEQSYNPKNLSLLYMGEGPNRFWNITEGKRIPQNILWACYNDSLTAEEISLQIGVALPYLEGEIQTLEKAGLLIQKSGRYKTNIIIFTDELKLEVTSKIEKKQEAIADKIHGFITENENKIRSIGFHMHDMSKNSFMWHITYVACVFLFGKINENIPFPQTAFGDKAFVWGDESPRSIINFCSMSYSDGTLDEGELRFLDYLPAQKSDNNYFYRNLKLAKFFVIQQVPGIICMRMFDDVIGASVEIMCQKDYLKTSWNAREMPTVYAVID